MRVVGGERTKGYRGAVWAKCEIYLYKHFLMNAIAEHSEYVPIKTRKPFPSESSASPTDTSVFLTRNTEASRRPPLMGPSGTCAIFFTRVSKAERKLPLRMPLMTPVSKIILFQGKLTSRTLPSHSVGSLGRLYPWQDIVSLIFIFLAAAVIRGCVGLFTTRVLPTLSVLGAELTTEESGSCSYFHSEYAGTEHLISSPAALN